jgi:hypothetical protein
MEKRTQAVQFANSPLEKEVILQLCNFLLR